MKEVYFAMAVLAFGIFLEALFMMDAKKGIQDFKEWRIRRKLIKIIRKKI